jgi:hypothetical protein
LRLKAPASALPIFAVAPLLRAIGALNLTHFVRNLPSPE